MSSALEGGCVCGGTRYRLDESPVDLADCHCIDCRKSSGAPFVTWGTVRRDRMQVTRGELRNVPHAGRIRSFAACCGTHLFFAETPGSAMIDVTIASFDDPTPFAPKMAIWTEERLPWVVLNEHLPAYRRSSRDA